MQGGGGLNIMQGGGGLNIMQGGGGMGDNSKEEEETRAQEEEEEQVTLAVTDIDRLEPAEPLQPLADMPSEGPVLNMKNSAPRVSKRDATHQSQPRPKKADVQERKHKVQLQLCQRLCAHTRLCCVFVCVCACALSVRVRCVCACVY